MFFIRVFFYWSKYLLFFYISFYYCRDISGIRNVLFVVVKVGRVVGLGLVDIIWGGWC